MPLSLEDKFEIQELMNRFIQTTDLKTAEDMRPLFTPDGRFVIDAMEIDVVGIDNIVAFLEEVRGKMPGKMFHALTNFVVEGDGDAATVSCASQALQADDGRVQHFAFGYYHDQLVRTSDGWRIKEHNLTLMA